MNAMSNMSNMSNSNIPNMSSISNMPISNMPNMPNMYQSNQTSIALFHIPSDATNSLYIDGIPNDASEREVSRTKTFSTYKTVFFALLKMFRTIDLYVL